MNEKYINLKGFGLIEAMVAMVVTSIIALGIATVVQNTVKSSKTADQASEATGLLNISMQVMDTPESCVSLLSGTVMPTDNTWYPYIGTSGNMVVNGTPIAQLNTSYAGLSIASMRVNRGVAISTLPLGASKNIFTFQMNFQRADGSAFGSREFTRDFRFIGTVDAAGAVTACHGILAGAGDSQMACLAAGGQWDASAIPPVPQCHWEQLAISSSAADLGDSTKMQFGATGLYVAGGVVSTRIRVNLIEPVAPSTSITLQGAPINVAGGITATGNIIAPIVRGTSDIRLKKDIHTINDALKKVLNLRGVYFNWKDQNISNKVQMGLVAQEVEKFIPEVVYTAENGTKSVAYGNLVGILIEALKEQQKQIQQLQQKMDSKVDVK